MLTWSLDGIFYVVEVIVVVVVVVGLLRLDSNIESTSSNNTNLNIIKIFNKLPKKLNII